MFQDSLDRRIRFSSISSLKSFVSHGVKFLSLDETFSTIGSRVRILVLSIYSHTLSCISLKRYHGILIFMSSSFLGKVTVFTFLPIWCFALFIFLFVSFVLSDFLILAIIVFLGMSFLSRCCSLEISLCTRLYEY